MILAAAPLRVFLDIDPGFGQFWQELGLHELFQGHDRYLTVGERIGGNIGDRDHLRHLGRDYDLIEAQGRRGDFATWRVYLHDRTAGTTERLEIVTHKGSTAFANPTATALRDPAGREAIMVTMFLPLEGAAPGEAGSLSITVMASLARPAGS